MLITFESNAHTDVTMFADIANSLIKMMGHSGTIPSAIAAKDVPAALEHLHKALEAHSPEELVKSENEDEEELEVSKSGRAFPLVEMLKASIKENQPVMWYEKK
jgi:Domain of unknown function (DUF1840)